VYNPAKSLKILRDSEPERYIPTLGDIRDIKLWRVTDVAKSKFVAAPAINVQVRRRVAKLKELHDQELILRG
jgi:hypothetical protein